MNELSTEPEPKELLTLAKKQKRLNKKGEFRCSICNKWTKLEKLGHQVIIPKMEEFGVKEDIVILECEKCNNSIIENESRQVNI